MGQMVGDRYLDGRSPVADKGVLADMKALSKHIRYESRSDVIRLFPLGDLHLGNGLAGEDELKEVVEEIASDPLAYWCGMGDMIECITRKDFRHLESQYAEFLWGEDDVVWAQKKRLLKILRPIAPKCLFYLEGNHEQKLRQHGGRDAYHSIVEELIKDGADPPIALGAQGFVRLYMKRKDQTSWSIVIYATHGWGGGRLEGSLPLKLGRLLKSYDADLFLFAHHHRQVPLPAHRVGMKTRGDKLSATNVYVVATGCFLKSYDITGEKEVYAESMGYPPLTIGCPIISITPDKKRINVTV